LSYGSRFLRKEEIYLQGPDVIELQAKLKEARYYTGNIDGIFADKTHAALSSFQADHNLKADGICGSEIWLKLNDYSIPRALLKAANTAYNTTISINVDKRKLYFQSPQLTKTFPVAVGKPSTPTPPGNWTIVQKALNPGGPFGARWMRLSIPWGGYGIHGTNNPKSIGKAYSHGCIRLHNKDVIQIYDLTPLGTPVYIRSSTHNARYLSLGNRGNDVKALQRQLKTLSLYPYKVDGYFGKRTELAVKQLQTDNALTPDGVVGPFTRTVIQKMMDVKQGNVEP
jgi:L,D-transpeptidase ErfK/SrfK